MTEGDFLGGLVGKWRGPSKLFFPGDEPRLSTMELRAKRIGGGNFVALEYEWAFEGKAQDGLLLVSREEEKGRWRAAWLDSWHMRSTLMDCVGELAASGATAVDVVGEYEVAEQPSWGWRTRVELRDGRLVLSMWNVSPTGAQELAVESLLDRI